MGSPVANAVIRRVPADYSTIQQAINAAVNGDTVLVAPGTYVENINFGGKAVTVTSEAGPQVTIIDGNHLGTVVTFGSGETSASVLNGFSIRNGDSPSGARFQGGGVAIFNASPIITNNLITSNKRIDEGGGIVIEGGSPTIRNNTITNNMAVDSGGGIAVNFGSPIIEGNQISHNQAPSSGGGISVLGTSTVLIVGNSITENTTFAGGGIELFSSGPVIIRNNVISDNRASFEGGGIDSVNLSPALIIQNLIVRNQSLQGGGIFWSNPPNSVINNTIADNDALIGSGIWAGFSRDTRFINNIVIGKSGQITFFCREADGLPTVFMSNDVFTRQGTAYGGSCPDQTGINGNISADPLFVNPIAVKYHLLSSSPAIDKGNNSAPNLPVTDFDGKPRIQDGNGDGIAIVDMGAYEFPAPFDLCIQDDSSSSLLQINTTTGEYQFTNCGGLSIGGTGTLTKRGSLTTLQHNSSDRRVIATIDTATGKATASVQLFSQGRTFSITDRNITNNTCACR